MPLAATCKFVNNSFLICSIRTHYHIDRREQGHRLDVNHTSIMPPVATCKSISTSFFICSICIYPHIDRRASLSPNKECLRGRALLVSQVSRQAIER